MNVKDKAARILGEVGPSEFWAVLREIRGGDFSSELVGVFSDLTGKPPEKMQEELNKPLIAAQKGWFDASSKKEGFLAEVRKKFLAGSPGFLPTFGQILENKLDMVIDADVSKVVFRSKVEVVEEKREEDTTSVRDLLVQQAEMKKEHEAEVKALRAEFEEEVAALKRQMEELTKTNTALTLELEASKQTGSIVVTGAKGEGFAGEAYKNAAARTLGANRNVL